MRGGVVADWQGESRDRGSKNRTKRTVFMNRAPIAKEAPAISGLQHQRRPKYRPRMKDLRRPVFCHAARLWQAADAGDDGLWRAPRRSLRCNVSCGPALRRNRGYRYSEHLSIRPRFEKRTRFLRRNSANPPVNSRTLNPIKSVRAQVSAEEWQTRVDLAACYRLTATYGMTATIAHHISCRVPRTHHHFL